eukprot:763247-Hanusia_phi.AAC.2
MAAKRSESEGADDESVAQGGQASRPKVQSRQVETQVEREDASARVEEAAGDREEVDAKGRSRGERALEQTSK